MLLIPEEGGRTYEFKIPRILALVSLRCWLQGRLCLLAIGARYLFRGPYTLSSEVERLERERRHLAEAVTQIDELEEDTRPPPEPERQAQRRILGSQSGYRSPQERLGRRPLSRSQYVSSVFRLQHGEVRTVPAMWACPGRPPPTLRQEGGAHRRAAGEPGAGDRRPAASPRQAYDRQTRPRPANRPRQRPLQPQFGHNRILLAEAGEYVFRGQPIALSGAHRRTGESRRFSTPCSKTAWHATPPVSVCGCEHSAAKPWPGHSDRLRDGSEGGDGYRPSGARPR